MGHARRLPGLAPDFTRFDLLHEGAGVWRLSVHQGEGPGFVTAQAYAHYEFLTLEEALDVMAAVVDAL